MDDLLKEIDTKLELLRFINEDTKKTMEKRNVTNIDRHKATMATKIDEACKLKVTIQEQKFLKGEKAEEVRDWTNTIEQQLETYDSAVASLNELVNELKENASTQARAREAELATIARQNQFNDQLEFDKTKFELKLQQEAKFEEARKGLEKPRPTNTKLPKLVITRFNGTHTDWFRFWNQFEAEIDMADVPPVTKFSYLKELVDPKVRASINGLPFSTEGYQRAKNILKLKYGNKSEIVNAYVQNITNLPAVHGTNAAKINDFYDNLLYNVQSLETLGKLREVNGYVRMTIDKLEGIRGDLVRTDDEWRDWDFPKLVEALRKWTERNPASLREKRDEKTQHPRVKGFKTEQQASKPKKCVYCDGIDHSSVNCKEVAKIEDRKRQLSEKRLCFNCTGAKHRASECRSRSGCLNCKRRHHTSICDNSPEKLLTATSDHKGTVIYPVVVVKVNGLKCRALIDTGAGSSYASSTLLDHLKGRPKKTEIRRIEMMFGTSTKKIGIYDLKIEDIGGKFYLETEVTRVERNELLTLDNPKYKDVIASYAHLTGVTMEDTDEKQKLPVHLILGTGDFAQIKTATQPKVGGPGEPIAELTKFGWTIISPGKEVADLSNVYLAQVSSEDYEQLCRLDVLGLADTPTGDQRSVYEEFKEQLTRHQDGWYETSLPWKGNHPPLDNNEGGSLKRLKSLVKKLESQNLLERYNDVIQDQLSQGIVEKAEAVVHGREFYLPHKAVVKESAESTKLRIVYDASARGSDKSPSLNDCLEIGPPLQNQLWGVLARSRFHPVIIAGDLKQAFLQVRIKSEDRDAMRFHWLKDLKTKEVETFRFTRALFGLGPSPFLLGGVIQQHLESCKESSPEAVEEIRRSLYVDDMITGGETIIQAQQLKQAAMSIFGEATFQLHKWHSNVQVLETDVVETTSCGSTEKSYAKQQLGATSGECGMLGLSWDKRKDTIAVVFPTTTTKPTKREILGKIAKIYDPLGLVSPVTLQGKILYRDACDEKIPWDAALPRALKSKWERWERGLPKLVSAPRSLAKFEEPIQSITLHAFGDASQHGVGAVVIAVVEQASGVTQGLVAAKARLAKKGLTIPRLELVSAHMAANLVHNVREAIQGFPVKRVRGWLDSTVALHWIRGHGDYKQFVGNRVHKIREKEWIQWRHVSSQENPADLASRGGDVGESCTLWWQGPKWLAREAGWPPDIITSDTRESRKEAKVVKEIFAVTQQVDDELDQLLNKHNLWKTIRVCAWISRFVNKAKSNQDKRITGPLTTAEFQEQMSSWIKKVQRRNAATDKFQEEKLQLNLQKNQQGIYECRGRIQGVYPIYIPDSELLAERMVENAHLLTLHGGVGLTMAKIRESYWIPRLRRLTKQVIKKCYGCKRFRTTAFASPPVGNLPKDRTEGATPFKTVGVDYAGPIRYRTKAKKEAKAYIVLYACSLTRALYMELLPNLTTEEFLGSLKRLIARKGRPDKIYSDNGKTFEAAAKWLRQLSKDEKLNNYLAKQEIKWQFNLSRAPWWGGQFERMIGLVKRSLHKTIGKGSLTWKELQDVLLDVEVTLNNRPLCYVEEDVQMPLLTPNALLFGQECLLPEPDNHRIEDKDLRKRAKYLKRCKDAVWKRWTAEYVRSLRERHNLKHNGKKAHVQTGDVVLVKSEEKNRGQWKIGIVERLIVGKDGTARGAKLRTGKNCIERAIQHLYPMELSCDSSPKQPVPILSAKAPEFRPKREAASIAKQRIQEIVSDELSHSD